MKNFGIKQIGFHQTGTVKGGLLPLLYSGSWGDRGQGYTKENILLVCSAVNQLKSNWDMDTVIYICKQIVNNYGT